MKANKKCSWREQYGRALVRREGESQGGLSEEPWVRAEFTKQRSCFRKRKSMCGRPDTGNPPFEEGKEGRLEWRSVSKRENGVRSIDEQHRSQSWEAREPCVRWGKSHCQVVRKEM